MANILTKLPSEHEKILRGAFSNLITFGKLFLAGDFMKSKTPFFHYEVADELISPSNKPCAIIMPRGHGKTTLVKAKIVRDFCFAKKGKEWGFDDEEHSLFFGWVSSNQRKSKNNVAYVKLHLEYNDKINFYFGKNGGSLRGDTWNQEELVTAYGDRLISSSNLTSMRGDTLATIEQGAVRYSSVFIDDAENEENTRTQQSRDKIAYNIMDGIYPAITKQKKGCRLFLIETPVHFDAFAQRILDKWEKVKKEDGENEYMWKVLSYPATQPDLPGGVLWEDYWPRAELDKIKATYADSPRGVEGYFQEYELQVQSSENALWTRNHIKFHNYEYEWHEGQGFLVGDGDYIPVNTFLGCDPATDIETKNSDFSVIMVVAMDQYENIYVLDYERHRSIPTLALRNENGEVSGKLGVVDYIMSMYEKYHCKSGVVEDVAMNRSVLQSLQAEKRRLNRHNVGIVPEKPGGLNKINRIYSGLHPKFYNKKVYLKEEQHDLINEVVKFGAKMAHDDTIETLYYATRYSFPPKLEMGHFSRVEFKKMKRKPKGWKVA